MLKNQLKIAIYSGEIPSTTFIERLILGLSKRNNTLYLFGLKTKPTHYKDSIKVVAYSANRFQKTLQLLKYSILLSVFRKNEKRQLDTILRLQSTNLLYSKVKCYPVLWHKPDIFHIQWAKGLKEWAWVKEFGMTLVLSLRGAHINYSTIANPELAKMYRSYFPKVDGFHAVSKAISLEAIKYGAEPTKIKVVYSGLDRKTFKSNGETQNEIFEFVSIGRPHWKKGYHYALDACKILKEQGFEFKYTIVGGANDIELLYQQHDLGLCNEVVLRGLKSIEDVKTLIQTSDMMLLPSVEEGIANVVLEALALKTIVLTTNCGGMNEVIQDGVNGYIVPIRDSKAIANAIFKITKLKQEERTTIINNGFKTIKERHNEAQMIDGMMELYHFANRKNHIL